MKVETPAWMPPPAALLPPVAAFILQSLFWTWLHPLVWFLFYPAVFFSSWIGGLRGGLWATGMSTLLVWYFFIPPEYSFAIRDLHSILSIVVFVGMGGLFSLVHERLIRARREVETTLAALRSTNELLEVRVRERTAELAASRESIEGSEARMAGIVGSAMDAIISVDSHQTIVLFNAAAESMFGCPASIAMGQSLDRFVPQRFREAHRHHVEGFGKTGVTSRSMSSLGALSGVRADGSEFPIEASISQVEVGGQKTYTVILRDITERKRDEKAKALLAAIVESSADAIVGKDLEGIVTSWNAGAESMFGFAAGEIVGRSISIIIPSDRRDEEEQILSKIRRGESVEHFETVRQTKGGEGIAVSVTVSPIKDGQGRVVGASKVVRNITERRKVENELRTKEAQLHAADRRLAEILHGMTEACFALDDAWRFTFVNDQSETLLRHKRKELLGRTIWEVFHKLLGTPMEAHYRHAMAERMAVAFEAFSPIAERWLDVRLCPTPEGLAVFLLDVHERKLGVEALRASEVRFAKAFQSNPAAMCITTVADGRFIEVNERYCQLFGHAREELVGRTSVELNLWADPVIRSLLVERLRSDGSIRDFESRFRRKNGDMLDALISMEIIGVRDERDPVLISMFADITERKRAEVKINQLNAELEQRVAERTAQYEAANQELRHSRAELNSLFESLPGLYLVLTPELVIVSASDAYLKATLTTRAAILGRNLFEVFPDNPEDIGATGVSNLRASLDRVLHNAAPDTMAIQKYDVRRPDGVFEEHYWSPINSPVFGGDHQIKYIVHRVEEVTEFVRQKSQSPGGSEHLNARVQQMEAEIFLSSQKLQATNQKLEAANQELEAFSYSVSHDLRAPLRAMNGFSRAVLEDCGPQLGGDGERYLRIICDNAQRMGNLIDDLLTFSRLSRAPLNKRLIDTGALVRSSLEDIAGQREGRQIDLRIGGLPSCLGDPSLLKQVWINLLANAFKYTRKREAATVEVGCLANEAKCVYFVRDNGTGFDMRYAHKLFGVFQRLHRSEDFEGTGVGLAIVQRVVQRHGGRVWTEAAVDKGATFYFTLEGEDKS